MRDYKSLILLKIIIQYQLLFASLPDCAYLGYDAMNVAEHLVFLSSAKVNTVLRLGVQNVVGNDLMLYGERLSPENADVFRDKITTLLSKEWSE